MTRNAIVTAALLVAALALAVDAQAADKVTLKSKYVPGSYVQTATVQSSSTVGDTEMGKSTQVLTVAYTIAKPDDEGNTKITFQVKRMKMTTVGGGQQMVIDTDSPAEGEGPAAKVGEFFSKLTKAKVTIVIDPKGKVKEITGLDKMWDELAKTDPQMAAMAENMKKSMGDGMVRTMMKNMMGYMPDKAVAVGDEWTVEQPIPMPMLGAASMKLTYKLKAIEDDGKVAVIEMKGKLEPKPAAGGDDDDAPATPAMTMTMEGTLRVTIDNPLLATAEINTAGKMQQGAQAITFTSKTTTKVVKADDKKPSGKDSGDKEPGDKKPVDEPKSSGK